MSLNTNEILDDCNSLNDAYGYDEAREVLYEKVINLLSMLSLYLIMNHILVRSV